MKNNTKLIITNIFIIVIVSMICIIIFRIKKDVHSTNKFASLQTRLSVAKELANIWSNPNIEDLSAKELKQCFYDTEMIKFIHTDFYKCNPVLLNCLLAKKKFNVNLFTYDRRGEVILEVLKNEHMVRLKLQDTCSDAYLPQSIYSMGPVNIEKYIWDNTNRSIFVDKHYVSNMDVLIWKNRTGKLIDTEKQFLKDNFYLPSTSLSITERQSFCHEHGKSILQNHIFDATTQPRESSGRYLKKYPYHFTKKRKKIEKDCFNILSKDCVNSQKLLHYNPIATSWNGIYHALGNYMEYLPNPFYERANLKLSSMYLPSKSPWHELGHRSFWDGEFGTKVFEEMYRGNDDFKVSLDDYKVAFRCFVEK